MTEAQIKAIAALEAYGYVLRGTKWVRPGRRTQEWEAIGEGFERFDPGELDATPYRGLTAEEAKEAGSFERLQSHNFRDPSHKDLFVWEWPAEEVERIYAAGLAARTEPIEV